jgi:DNA-binding SARP family transcriptional activator
VESVWRLAAALGLGRRQAASFVGAARADTGRRAATTRRPSRAGSLRLGVLGPLAVWDDGLPVTLGRGMRQAVLGLLALYPNTALHREMIIDALWGDDPPATAVAMIQSYVSRLRRLLAPGQSACLRGGLLISTGTSYRLRVTADELDQLAFSNLATCADKARAAGDVAVACEGYARALGMWRGEPLADVHVLLTHPALTNLRQQRAEVVLGYAEAASMAGWHNRVLPHLRQLAHAEPLNERVRARLMVALAGSGQQAAALHAYEDLRRRLDDELGIRPGAEVADTHMRVLRQQIPAATGVARRHRHLGARAGGTTRLSAAERL